MQNFEDSAEIEFLKNIPQKLAQNESWDVVAESYCTEFGIDITGAEMKARFDDFMLQGKTDNQSKNAVENSINRFIRHFRKTSKGRMVSLKDILLEYEAFKASENAEVQKILKSISMNMEQNQKLIDQLLNVSSSDK